MDITRFYNTKKRGMEKVMLHSNYKGDFAFTNSEKLNIQRKIN